MAVPLTLSGGDPSVTAELTDELATNLHAWSYIEVYNLCSSVEVVDCDIGDEKYAKGKSTESEYNG
jgi:hypothetical protein